MSTIEARLVPLFERDIALRYEGHSFIACVRLFQCLLPFTDGIVCPNVVKLCGPSVPSIDGPGPNATVSPGFSK